MLQVFNEEDLTVLYEARDTKKQVTDLKYVRPFASTPPRAIFNTGAFL